MDSWPGCRTVCDTCGITVVHAVEINDPAVTAECVKKGEIKLAVAPSRTVDGSLR